jgi:hypothetical protein
MPNNSADFSLRLMSTGAITFTPEAAAHIAFFAEHSQQPLQLFRTWGVKVTAKDGRVVLHDSGLSVVVSSVTAPDNCVPLYIGGHTVYVSFEDFSALCGYTIYLSTGHSSDPAVTCGDLLKVA